MLDRDLVDVDLELLGNEHRQRRIRALPHLDHRRDERHLAGAIEAQERVRRKRCIGRQRVTHLGATRHCKAEKQPAAERGGRDHEAAPRRRSDIVRVHVTPPYR
jgi:hypothetical protein